MRLAVLILFLFLPLSAYAEPFSLSAVLFTVLGVSVTVGGAITAASIAITISTTVFGFVQSAAAKKKAKRRAARARADFLESLHDKKVTRIATEAPYRYVYGRDRVGANIVAIFVNGNIDQFQHVVCEFAAHESDEIEKVFVNKKDVGPLDGDGNVTEGDYFKITPQTAHEEFVIQTHTLSHQPTSSFEVIAYGIDNIVPRDGPRPFSISVPYTLDGLDITVNWIPSFSQTLTVYRITYQWEITKPFVRVKKHLGVAGEAADASLISEFPDKWTVDSKLSGHTYIVVRLDVNEEDFQNGIPDIEVVLRGKKLFDPRTGLTEWSQNPALVRYDYLTSEFCNVAAADLPVAHFITAANVCDEVRAFGPLYTFNGIVTADQDRFFVLDAMTEADAGTLVATTWETTSGKYVAPSATLNQSDIVGGLTVLSGISDADVNNGVRGQYADPINDYVVTDFEPFQNAAFRANDGRDKYINIDFPFTNSKQRVHNLARIFIEDQRNAFSIEADFSYKAWDRRVGDRVNFDSSFLGQTQKVFRITHRKYSPGSPIKLTLKEDAPEIWDEADTVTVDSTPNSDIPSSLIVAPIGFITLESGTNALLVGQDGTITSRILATWPAVTSANIDRIEVEWQKQGESIWNRSDIDKLETNLYLAPVEDLSWYIVRIRSVNQSINKKSDWKHSELHQVVGKSEPPSDLSDFLIDGRNLTWTNVFDIDLAGYRLRFHFDSSLDWNSANPLHDGLITENPFNLIALPFGPVTIMGKAVDSSGNESLNAAVIFTDLGDIPVANNLEELSYDPSFPGTLTDCLVVSNELVANSVDSFYGADNQSFYGSDPNASAYKAAAGFRQMVYEPPEFAPKAILPGSNITLSLDTEGIDVLIEYRFSGKDPAYGQNDGDSMYGQVDTDPFYEGMIGSWQRWPGLITAEVTGYEFRVTIGTSEIQGKIKDFNVIVDAPDIVESVADIVSAVAPTNIPFNKSFTKITSIQATLQVNGSGAETIEIDKSVPLQPNFNAYNSSHVAVAGAKADFTIQGF